MPALQIFGHRAAAGEAPENTLAAIRHAIALGIRHVEIDLRLSADLQLVVIHDYSLQRTTNSFANVSDLSAKQLSLLEPSALMAEKISTAISSSTQAYGVPTLKRFMDFSPEIECYQLEIKSDDNVNPQQIIEKLAAIFPDAASATRVVITSFDCDLIESLKNQCPYLTIGLIAKQNKQQALLKALALNCNYLCLHYSLLLDSQPSNKTTAFIKQVKASSLHLSVWTVNDKQSLNTLLAIPVDSVITDYPTNIMSYMQRSKADNA